VTEKELFALLREVIATRYLVIALVQLLVERGVLKGSEAEILSTLDQWAKDLEREDSQELLIQERARTLVEAWTKLPKQ
jgi:hypothetical protein